MCRKALTMQLLLVAAVFCSAAGRHPLSAAARIQKQIIQQQSIKLRQLQQTQTLQPLLGLDTKNKKLRVLAFGDSITEGWINSLQTKVPWTPQVQQKLQQKLGSNWSVEVVNGGVGSAGVLDKLNDAFRQQLADAKTSGRPYHYITFEAGINDLLLQNRSAGEIFQRMKELWNLANAAGSTVVVIPTLPTSVQGEREDQRIILTSMVRQYITSKRAMGYKGLSLLDLEAPFAYYSLTPQRRAQLFDDGVHFTAYGYDLLGSYVYQGLIEAMGLELSEKAKITVTHKSKKSPELKQQKP